MGNKEKDYKFDWDDVSIVPSELSDINSRSEIEIKKLPILSAPMDTVVDINNAKYFQKYVDVCLPRGIKWVSGMPIDYFYSYGLDEIIEMYNSDEKFPPKILIDIANAHMNKLYIISKLIKEKYKEDVELMVGNIANPDTYRKYCEIGVDWIRCGIGGGSGCTTSANGAIHYPMASLISECYEISKEFENPSKIVADGGFKTYSDIIKALALGANMVMLGGTLNKCLESCGDNYLSNGTLISLEDSTELFEVGRNVFKKFRGMSTKEVQKKWGKKNLKTSEGIIKHNKVEYTLSGWTENFSDYLKTNMSYCNKISLKDYVGKVEYVFISQNAFNRFNK